MAVPTFTNTGSIPNVTVDAVIADSLYQKINFDIQISGAGVANVRPRPEVYVRPAGGGSYRQVFDGWKTPNYNTGNSSIFAMATGLVPGTAYDVSKILTDIDGTNVLEIVTLNKSTLTFPETPAQLFINGTGRPVRYIREDGNDTQTGQGSTSGTAWRTWNKAMLSAPSNALILVQAKVGNCYYPRVTQARGSGLDAITFLVCNETFTGLSLASDDTNRFNGGPQDPNPGAHAILMEFQSPQPTGATPGTFCATAPASETDTRFQAPAGGKWQPFIHSSLDYTCWTWSSPGTVISSTPQWITWSATKTGKLWKIGVVKQQTGCIDSGDRACELLNTMRDAQYGAVWMTTSANGVDNNKLYLKLPPHALKADGTPTSNPNDLYMWAGSGAPGQSAGLFEALGKPNIRICGAEFRNAIHGVFLGVGADNMVVDHCEFRNHWVGIMARGTNGAADATIGGMSRNTLYANKLLQWRTRTIQTNLWSEDQVNQPSIPWAYIKAYIGKQGEAAARWHPFDSTTQINNRMMADNCECDGFWGKGGAKNTSYIENYVEGVFNGLSGDHTAMDLYAMYGAEVYGNLFRDLADDVFEPEKWESNWDIHHNSAHNVVVAVSTASAEGGPHAFYANLYTRIGVHGMRAVSNDISGQTWATGGAWKYKVPTVHAPLIYNVNNTYHCYRPAQDWTPTGYRARNSDGRFSAGGGTTNDIHFVEENNIYIGFNRDADISGLASAGNSASPTYNLKWTENNNYFHSFGDGPNGAGRGIGYANSNYSLMSDYRAATKHSNTKPQQGTNSNDGLPGGGLNNTDFRVAPHKAPNQQFGGDPDEGYQAMELLSGSVFRAAGKLTVAMRPGIDYLGAVPDLGAIQFGLSGAAPTPPATPTGVTATKNGSSQIDLTWTDAADNETAYYVRSSTDQLNWILFPALPANSQAYSNTGLPGLATRHYQVGAGNGAGISWSTTVSATTDPSIEAPPAPTSLTAIPTGYTGGSLTWTDQASNEISYRVERSIDNEETWETAQILPINSVAWIVSNMLAGQTAHFRVFAVNEAGDSLPSNVAVMTTPIPTGVVSGVRTTRPRAVASRSWAIRTWATRGTLLIPFDNAPGVNTQLNGDYPTGVINWGTGIWYLSSEFAQYSSKTLTYWDSIQDGSPNSESFTFVAPKILVSLLVFNSGVVPITVTITGAGGESKVQTIAAGVVGRITTGFTIPATTITLASTVGWDTNFDDLVIL